MKGRARVAAKAIADAAGVVAGGVDRWTPVHGDETYRDGVGLERYRCCLALVTRGHDRSRDCICWLLVTASECRRMAAGFVPRRVRDRARVLGKAVDV